MENKTCPFCKILKENSEEKREIIEETKNTFTILSNPALVKWHILVMPKRHVEKLAELNKEEKEELFSQAIKIQELLLKKCNGCDIRQNFRPFIKQNEFKINHLHIHLIPREFEDELYKKCMIFEKEVFKKLPQKELNEIKEEINKLRGEIKNAY